MEKLLADLDRFSSNPIVAFAILMLTVVLRVCAPDLIEKARKRKRKSGPKAQPDA